MCRICRRGDRESCKCIVWEQDKLSRPRYWDVGDAGNAGEYC